MADRRLSTLPGANGHVADLPVRRKIAQKNEVAQASLKGLLMQNGPEYARVETRGRLRVGHDDVEVLEAEILQGERRRRLCDGRSGEEDTARCRHDPAHE